MSLQHSVFRAKKTYMYQFYLALRILLCLEEVYLPPDNSYMALHPNLLGASGVATNPFKFRVTSH